MNLLAITDFPPLCVKCIFLSLFCKIDFIRSLSLSTHILFGLPVDSFEIPWKALVIVIPFLSFKGIIHAHLL